MKLERTNVSLLCDKCGVQLKGYSGSKWFVDMDMAHAVGKTFGWQVGKNRWEDNAICGSCYSTLEATKETEE